MIHTSHITLSICLYFTKAFPSTGRRTGDIFYPLSVQKKAGTAIIHAKVMFILVIPVSYINA